MLRVHHVYCSNIVNKPNYFIVLCDQNADKVFTSECIKALEVIKCSPVIPEQLRVARSALLFKCDDMITKHTAEEIKTNISQCNNINVLNVIKISKRTLKVEFDNEHTCQKVVSGGLFLFNLSIPASCISEDRYIEIEICYTCYNLDGHISKDCPKKELKVCSTCSSTTHRHTECQSAHKKCINCGGAHSALALSCPERKKLVSVKRNNLLSNKTTYTSKVANASNASLPSTIPCYNSREVSVFTDLIIKLAVLNEVKKKGTFQDTVNELLKANGLPTFNMGSFVPPTSIFSADFITTESHQASSDKEIIHSSPANISIDSLAGNNYDEPAIELQPASASDLETSPQRLTAARRRKTNTGTSRITIYKKRSTKLQPASIRELVYNKSVFVQSDTLPVSDCISLLEADFSLALVKDVSAKEFQQKIDSLNFNR